MAILGTYHLQTDVQVYDVKSTSSLVGPQRMGGSQSCYQVHAPKMKSHFDLLLLIPLSRPCTSLSAFTMSMHPHCHGYHYMEGVCLQMFYILSNYLCGLLDGFEVIVDHWPKWTCIILRPQSTEAVSQP